MKNLIFVAFGLFTVGCVNNSEISQVSKLPPVVSLQKERLQEYIAGYEAMERAQCNGIPTGIIRIHVSELLDKLSKTKNIGKREDMDKIELAGTPPGIGKGKKVVKPSSVPIFPTIFDIETAAINSIGPNEELVGPGKFVYVRVILDQAKNKNDNVRFMYPAQYYTDPTFAILKTKATTANIFCDLKDIDYTDPEAPFVQFGIQSAQPNATGNPIPATGGFGIGLVVIDGGYLTPIIIDPNVKNRG